jgi:hypothetical protein
MITLINREIEERGIRVSPGITQSGNAMVLAKVLPTPTPPTPTSNSGIDTWY